MLLNSDTARISIQKLHPITHKDYFLNRQINLIDQLATNSNSVGQENSLNNDTDDMSVGDINEITFSVLIDDGNNDDEMEEDEDEDEEENYDDEEGGEQEESDEEKRVNKILIELFFS